MGLNFVGPLIAAGAFGIDLMFATRQLVVPPPAAWRTSYVDAPTPQDAIQPEHAETAMNHGGEDGDY